MNKVYTIGQDGSITGLWDDELADIGNPQIKRASEVEFDTAAGGWKVKILVGEHAGKVLPGVFKKRKEALEAEVKFLNQELLSGQLSYDS